MVMTKNGKLLIYNGKIALEEDQCDCVCGGTNPCDEYPSTLYARLTFAEGTACQQIIEFELLEVAEGNCLSGHYRTWQKLLAFDFSDYLYYVNSVDVGCTEENLLDVCLYTYGAETTGCTFAGGIPLYIFIDEPECGAPAVLCPDDDLIGNIYLEIQDTPF